MIEGVSGKKPTHLSYQARRACEQATSSLVCTSGGCSEPGTMLATTRTIGTSSLSFKEEEKDEST